MLQDCHKSTIYSPQGTPILSQDFIQSWTRSFIEDWLSRHNHTENKDTEIPGMDIKVDTKQTATNIPECMLIPQQQHTIAQDDHLPLLKGYIIVGCPENQIL